RKLQKLPALALLIALAVVSGCEKEDTPPAERKLVDVKVMTIVAIESKADAFELHAKVEPNRVVHVAAEVDGRIEEVCCKEGQRVQAGPDSKPIIKLNTDLLAARVKQAKAQHDIDQLNHKRMIRLRASNTATQSELEHIREQTNASKAALDEARARLDRTQIHPPIDGVLNHRPVEKGDYVQAGTVVAEIVDADTVKIVAHVPERDIHFLKLGDKAAIIYTYRRQERKLEAEITFISKLAHRRALTTQIEVKIDNSAGEFFSGQIVSLRLKRRELKNVIMIPMDSVIPVPQDNGQSKYAAYVVDKNNKASRRAGIEIDLAFIEGKNVRLISGLIAGDKLIVEGHRYVGPGQPVKVINRSDKATTKPASQPKEGT
ncbi:MAG: efflux RND transporter periplasmic adaptor subunit, partial [bacterium]|nr:efflux RND transporter periplasmic adaptor subunit [bacterium]